MKPKLDIPTKLNSLLLIVLFAMVLLPTCKKNEHSTSLFDKWQPEPSKSSRQLYPANTQLVLA